MIMPKERLVRMREFAVALPLVAIILTYVIVAVVTVFEYGLRYPAFDQFRSYVEYLERPFPDNVLQVENGHRPILPAMIRVAEIECCGASQTLQLALGTALAGLTWILLAWSLLRERAWPWPRRLTALATVSLALLWLCNARMWLHGNESVHIYMVMSALMIGTWATWRASASNGLRWMVLAAVCASAATFSFGAGIVVFPVLFLIAVLLGVRKWALLPLPLALGACLFLYLVVLPNNVSVQDSLRVMPIENFLLASRWLASPWVQAWLGLGAHLPLQGWAYDAMQGSVAGRLLASTASTIAPSGAVASSLPTVIGAAGYVFMLWTLVLAWRRRASLPVSAWLALALILFGAGISVLISVARFEYFSSQPAQIFAERYVVWPCLFWGGLAMFAIALPSHAGWQRLRWIAVPLVMAVACFLWPTEVMWRGWGAAVNRQVERSALAARMGIWDPHVLPDNSDARRAHVERTLALMQARRLGPFQSRSGEDQGRDVIADEARDPGDFHRVGSFADGGKSILRIEGRLSSAKPAGTSLWVVDAQGRRVGGAIASYHHRGLRKRLFAPGRDGFDGYVIDPQPGAVYRVRLADAECGPDDQLPSGSLSFPAALPNPPSACAAR